MTQIQVYNAMKGVNTEKWTRPQLILHQVIKLAEGLGKLAGHVSVEKKGEVSVCLSILNDAQISAGEALAQGPFESPQADLESIRRELTNIQISVYCLASLLDIDVMNMAWKEATQGRRK